MENALYDRIDALPIHPVEKYRIKMTIQCKDCEYIPKVSQAGQTFDGVNGRYQLMHNGVKVIEGGYLGLWTTELIKILHGHHEPQEEKAFYEILKCISENATMIELGSWWSYYSMWFQKEIANAQNYMIEPDPTYLEIGKQNFALNGMTGHFYNAAIGKNSIEDALVRCESDNIERPIPIISVDDFCERENIKYVDLLLCDIQGYELEMLQGAEKSMEKGIIRFMVISTHHHTISNDPLIHQRCLSFLQEMGAHILVEHTIYESYSGDGLIVASLSPDDQNLPMIEVSRNYSRSSLFRELEYDLVDAIEDRKRVDLERDAFRNERDALRTERNALRLERDNLQNLLTQVCQSRSWRITRPLREANLFIRQSKLKITSSLYEPSSLLRQITKRLLGVVLRFVLARPGLKELAKKIIVRFPSLNTRLRIFTLSNWNAIFSHTKENKGGLREELSSFQEEEAILDVQIHETSAVIFPSPRGERRIYFYVDHTIKCPSNTGMQRVTRRLGRALLELGEEIIFVKWDARHHQLILLNQDELSYLSQWNGPVFSLQTLSKYPKPNDQVVQVGRFELEAGHWLVVPEVTHITYQAQPMTLDVLMEAKRHGLKTAFVYYDATPLRQTSLREMAPKHETYMHQLLLVDLVVPISNWSARDLVSFLQVHEGAILTPTPRIAALPLPGESQLSSRITTPITLNDTSKLILSVGSIVPHKNQVALVHAFESYCKVYPETDWQLALVGNLHPDVENEIKRATKKNSRILFMDHISDDELNELYRSCSFTVFPSIEEGFGLPILESLWYARPCICANFGSMGEVAEGGGCITVDTRETDEILRAIIRLTMEDGLLKQLSQEAVSRSISNWTDYGQRFIRLLEEVNDPLKKVGVIYYWVDHTASHPANSGIQRVVRGLARALLENGLRLIPVKWDKDNQKFYSPSEEELRHLSQWNGPQLSAWSSWTDPTQANANDWILIPELVSDPAVNLTAVKQYATKLALRCAWVFYDAIPWKRKMDYPSNVSEAHRKYMESLNDFELIFPISHFSRSNLISFLAASPLKTPNLEKRAQTCVLPGEFLESERVLSVKKDHAPVTKILCVGTVEPRKNHLVLLQAFSQIVTQVQGPVELIIAGGDPYPELAAQVEHFIDTIPGIYWEKDTSDTRLGELYAECDFTVYPSLEEGFGLPILESLWYARPCICRDSGAMAEVAEGGGCLKVETADAEALATAMLKMVENDSLRTELAREAVNRSFKTWNDYAREMSTRMAVERYIPLVQPLPESIDREKFYDQFKNLQHRPLLSICISTYNRADWLSVSLKNLTRLIPDPSAEIEVVVCDNASSDHTPDVVQPYLERTDFCYYRNPENVGMLGNLRVTAHHAKGRYIWILGDDDLVKPGSIEKVLHVIQNHPEVALVYLNYAHTRQADAKAVTNLDRFLEESTPVVPPGEDFFGPVSRISTKSENFFTAIYCLIFRRDHALRAYSQNTEGRPFSTMLTCIPTTYYTLNFMMNEFAYWIGDPQVVVNLNVSWMKYASIWILERLPEAHDIAEKMGADPLEIDRCRINHLPHVWHWYREIYEPDPEENYKYFSPFRLITRMKHLNAFSDRVQELQAIYENAYAAGHPGAKISPSQIFQSREKENR